MAATFTTNIKLGPNNEFSSFIEWCNPVGAYIKIGKSEIPEGSHGIFHIVSADNGQKSVKKDVVSGSNGERLSIIYPEDESPILCYATDEHAPQEDRHYNLKII